jgi:hypothetical protein
MSPNPNDATSLLINRIKSELSAAGISAPAAGVGIVSQADSLLGDTADWAQLLSLPGGAAAQALADVNIGTVVGEAAATGTSTAAGDSAALAAAGAAGTIGAAAGSFIVAAIILVVAAILAALTGSSDSESSEGEQLQLLSQEIAELENDVLKVYWNGVLMGMMTLWGQVQADLDNLASQGLQGNYVTTNVSHFHDDAMKFVNNFIPSETLGTAEQVFWQRPGLYDEVFSAQDVFYPSGSLGDETGDDLPGNSVSGWYGAWPQGQPAYPPAPPGGPGFTNPPLPAAPDPRSMLPFLLVGIKSYLTIQAVVHYIDKSQPGFSKFRTQFQGKLQGYANFLLQQFNIAITGSVTDGVLQGGIVKTDIPSNKALPSEAPVHGDVMTFLCMIAESQISGPWPEDPRWGGSYAPEDPPFAGYAWNGVYGAVDTHPNYGMHQPPPPITVPAASASYIVDLIDYANLGAELLPVYQGVPNAPPGLKNALARGWWKPPVVPPLDSQIERVGPLNFFSWLNWWTIPWVTMRVILGTMARWKALYLFNGYDTVWSAIQNLNVIAGQPLLPTPTLAQDGMQANGNWSARELIARISSISPVFYETPEPRTTSLWFLVQTLDTIVNGNWAGPPAYSASNGAPARPLGFRDRLAAAAV